MTKEQEYYVVGLSDALEVIKSLKDNQISIGNYYYVIVKNTKDVPKYIVEKMRLYRINCKEKYAYCFTRNPQHNTPDLVLYSTVGLRKRVFDTYDEAEANIKYIDL